VIIAAHPAFAGAVRATARWRPSTAAASAPMPLDRSTPYFSLGGGGVMSIA